MTQTALAEPRVDASDDAFEQLYREHVATVYRYALGVLRNPADAEDVAQSTFTNAYRAIRGGEWPTKPENWLITIAHNECRQRFRRLGRRAVEVPLDDEVAERARFDETAETAEAVEDVLNALAGLPFNQRAALVLREVSGRSAAEIAQVLGTSAAAVDMLIFRARRTLRTQYAAVKTLVFVPLPRSLLSFGGGSAAAKAGAVAGGLGVVGKVAAVLTAGAVAAGAGLTGLEVRDHRGQPAVEPKTERPIRAQGEPVEEVRGNPPVPPIAPEAPAAATLPTPSSQSGSDAAVPTPESAVPSQTVPSPPGEAPSVSSPPVIQPPEVPAPPSLEPPALPPVEPPALPPVEPPAPPPVSTPPLPTLPVEPPPVTVPPVEVPTVPLDLPAP